MQKILSIEMSHGKRSVRRDDMLFRQQVFIIEGRLPGSGGQNDDFRPLASTLGGRGMGCRDKYVTS
jgi:hypothetical protein